MNEVALWTSAGEEVPTERGRWIFKRKTGYTRKPLGKSWSLLGDTFHADEELVWERVSWPLTPIVGFKMCVGDIFFYSEFNGGPCTLTVGDTLRLRCSIDVEGMKP